jgi:hypothetical protein
LLQHNEKGDNNVVVIAFFLFVCRAGEKATITTLLLPFSFCLFAG